MKNSLRYSALALALFAAVTLAKEIPPGHIVNPDGLQRFQGAAYNSELDEYLLIYQGGDAPRARRLGTNGNFLAPEVRLDKAIGVANVHVVYNPDHNQYLAIYRSDNAIFGRYLDGFGIPLGSRFRIGTGGEVGRAAYSTKSRRYLVAWRKGPRPIQVQYAVIHGNSTAPNSVVKSASLANGDNAHAAWGSVKDKFLVVYTREVGTAVEEVFGKLVNGDGSSKSSEFKIMGGPKAQTGPQVGYASSRDVFLVSVSDWRNVSCCRADVVGQLLDSAGNKVGSRFDIVATGNGGWDVTGPIGFNKATGQFLATSYVEPSGYAREIDPRNGSKGPKIELANELSVPIAIAMRPHPSDPQGLILTRSNLGGNGIHAHILHLTAGPPVFTSNKLPDGGLNVSYSEKAPVAGGTTPLTFELLSPASALAPGIKGPDPDTGIFSGKATAAGTFPFEVKVTDQKGRSAKATLTHTIRLAAPTLLSPVSVTTSERKPTFQWTAVPGATSYRLVVNNLTGGNTPINRSNINGTSFTPGSNLPAGKLFQWRVQALGDGTDSPFSPDAVFEIDTAPPPKVVLIGSIPQTLAETQDLVAIAASSEHKESKKMENLVDGKNKTSWMSKGTAKNVPEQVTVDLGSTFEVRQVALRSKRGPRFPEDFQIQISDQPTAGFSTLASASAFQASGNTWYPFDVTPTRGRYIRILTTKKGFHRGSFWAEISELTVSGVGAASGTIEYHWQAPPDDEGSGTEPVVTYDLRIRPGDEKTFDYTAAKHISWTPTPVLSGEQSVRVQGLPDEMQIAAAMTSIDDAGNRSPLSNIVVLSTPGIPPGAVKSLRAFNPGATSVELDWTAPGDDGNQGGPASSYDLRYSKQPIDADNFDQATQVDNEPVPAAPGTKQSLVVDGLASNTTYYFAIRSRDDAGNLSLLSNVVSRATLDGTAPAPITDLTAESGGIITNKISSLRVVDVSSERTAKGFVKENLVDGDVATHWSSTGTEVNVKEHITVDLGKTITVAEVRMRSDSGTAEKFPPDFEIQVSNSSNSGFTTIRAISGFTATPSTWYGSKVTPTEGRYFRVFITKKSLRNGKYWAQIAELEVIAQFDATDGITLTWTATGDDGKQGTAASYDMRYWDQEIVDNNDFENNAAQVDPELLPNPQPAGLPETVSFTGLNPGKVYWVAIKARDERGNTSGMSNVLKVATPVR